MDVKLKPKISAQLDRIWEHTAWKYLDASKGTWPVMEGQKAPRLEHASAAHKSNKSNPWSNLIYLILLDTGFVV
jgi:hypothetical protein